LGRSGNGINYAPSTGIITNTGVVSLAATYPLQTSASTGNLTISTAFGTTTNNVFSGTNTFNAASAFTAAPAHRSIWPVEPCW